MEVVRDFDVFQISVTKGTLVNGSDFPIQPCRNGVGEAIRNAGYDSEIVSGDQLGVLADGLQTAVCRLVIPASPEAHGPTAEAVVPPLSRRFPEEPWAGAFQLLITYRLKVRKRRLTIVLANVQPLIVAFRTSMASILSNAVNRLPDSPTEAGLVDPVLSVFRRAAMLGLQPQWRTTDRLNCLKNPKSNTTLYLELTPQTR